MSEQTNVNPPMNRTIPIFPCVSMDEQLDFYKALGFRVTYHQKSPYKYACVVSSFTELHFNVQKQLNPAGSTHTCYIAVSDVDAIYQEARTGVKQVYGKIPTRGIPRISKLNTLSEDRRFTITDPGGNTIMIGQSLKSLKTTESDAMEDASLSNVEKLYAQAYRFAYSKEDLPAAAKVIDLVYKKHQEELTDVLCVKVMVLQADIAHSSGNMEQARQLLTGIHQIKLNDQERSAMASVLERALDIEKELHS